MTAAVTVLVVLTALWLGLTGHRTPRPRPPNVQRDVVAWQRHLRELDRARRHPVVRHHSRRVR